MVNDLLVNGLVVNGRIDRADFMLAVELAAEPGTVVAVLGPNGSGKTTLLRAVAGLTPFDTGLVEVKGVAWQADSVLPSRLRSVGLVLAQPTLFPHLSVLDNVAYGPRARGVSRTVARARAATELAAVGLASVAADKPRSLSTGMAQRVSLARALAADPAVLLLDEPLSALDVQTRADTRAMLGARLTEYDGVTLLVSHDPLDALTLADRVVVMEAGAVVQDSVTAEAIAHPRTPYAARMVGLNLLHARRANGRILAGRNEIQVAEAPSDDALLLTISPQAVSLWTDPPTGSARNTWQLRVTAIELIGQTARVSLDGAVTLIAEVTAQSVATVPIKIGAPIWVTVKATQIHAYPAPERRTY